MTTQFVLICRLAQFNYAEIRYEARNMVPDADEANRLADAAIALRDAIEEIAAQRSGPADGSEGRS